MSWVAVAVGGGAIVGAYMNSQAMGSAAATQGAASQYAADVQERIFNQQRRDNEPWRAAGGVALSQMQDPYFSTSFDGANFDKDPGYQFRMEEGQKALERSASARGGLNSGGTLKALARYSQGVASDEYGKAFDRFNTNQTNRFNRLASLANVGQTANQSNAQSGQNYANNVGDAAAAGANASAAGTVGSANAYTNAFNTGANTWMQTSMMNRMFPQQQAPGMGIPSAGGSYNSYANMG